MGRPAVSLKRLVLLVCGSALALLAVGTIALMIATTPSSASSSSAPDAGPLDVFLHTGMKGLRITNDTDKPWTDCMAAITGSYTARVADLVPRGVVEVYYREFAVGSTALNEADAYGRAIRGTVIRCTGVDDERHDARIR